MPDSPLTTLPVGQHQVKAALARERRRAVRKRLVAIRETLDGKSIKQAAAVAKATRGSVESWLKQVRQSGLQALLLDRRRRYPKRKMPAAQVKALRRQIASALARPLKPHVRARLVAIDAVLSDQPIDEAAAAARVLPNAVKSWLRAVTYQGFAAALAKWESPGPPRPQQLDADPAALRKLAAKEKNPRVRKRMLALAFVAEGRSPHDAGMRSGLTPSAVPKWIARFRKEGIAGFQGRTIPGRPSQLDDELGPRCETSVPHGARTI